MEKGSLRLRGYYRQLSNKEFYEELSTDNTNENKERVKKAVTKEIDDGNLTQDCKVLIQKKPRCSVFYMLPKIHKIDSPGRPIVSACSCPTELISSFVDDILQPLVKKLPSFCKDTDDVLVKIDQCKIVFMNLFSPWMSNHYIQLFLMQKAFLPLNIFLSKELIRLLQQILL